MNRQLLVLFLMACVVVGFGQQSPPLLPPDLSPRWISPNNQTPTLTLTKNSWTYVKCKDIRVTHPDVGNIYNKESCTDDGSKLTFTVTIKSYGYFLVGVRRQGESDISTPEAFFVHALPPENLFEPGEFLKASQAKRTVLFATTRRSASSELPGILRNRGYKNIEVLSIQPNVIERSNRGTLPLTNSELNLCNNPLIRADLPEGKMWEEEQEDLGTTYIIDPEYVSSPSDHTGGSKAVAINKVLDAINWWLYVHPPSQTIKKVAIIDTPIYQHGGLEVSRFYNAIYDSEAPPVDPTEWGHGTKVAAIIKAVAPNTQIIGVEACEKQQGKCRLGDVIRGVCWAVDIAGADIVNMSLGGEGGSNILATIITEMARRSDRDAKAKKTFFSMSGPNSGSAQIHFPAMYSPAANTLRAIGTLKMDGTPRSETTKYLDLLVPLPDEDPDFVGTSFATPIISGLLAEEKPLTQSYLEVPIQIRTFTAFPHKFHNCLLNPITQRQLDLRKCKFEQVLSPGR